MKTWAAAPMSFVLDVTSQGLLSRIPFTVTTGNLLPIELFTDDVESGEAKWTHGSGIKKKNRVDTWRVSSKRIRSAVSLGSAPIRQKVTDSFLASVPISLPSDGRNLELVFYHTYEFEGGTFDGGVIEISTGGDFEDLGAKILRGKYTGTISDFDSNPLGGRSGWVEGRLGRWNRSWLTCRVSPGRR